MDLFSTTSTLSVGSTGSQARLIQSSHAPATYQPILVKDLGKNSHDPHKFTEQFDRHSMGGGGGVIGGDDEDKITEQVMDRHLSELVADHLDRSNICDIVQYMANLKEKHMESELKLDLSGAGGSGGTGKQRNRVIIKNGDSTETDVESGTDDQAQHRPTSDDRVKQSSEEEEHSVIVIDRRVDKIFKSTKSTMKEPTETKRTSKISRQPIQMLHSSDRQTNQVSPVKIIKIKSPMNSFECSKRGSVSLSRDNSRERQSTGGGHIRRASEGGILLKQHTHGTSDVIYSTPIISTGILKHSPKSKSPERQNSFGSRKSLSPGTSFDSRSPYSSFESRSPECSRKRSLSAHMSSRQLHDSQHNHYPHTYYSTSRSPERRDKRLSKSLERNNQRDGYYSVRAGLSPDRVYQFGVPIRSHSAENGLTRNAIFLSRSNESLARSIENPTCVECLYQLRKTTQQQQQQKARARQSRARKKVPRGGSGNGSAVSNGRLKYQRSRSRSEESCIDCNDFYEIHV